MASDLPPGAAQASSMRSEPLTSKERTGSNEAGLSG